MRAFVHRALSGVIGLVAIATMATLVTAAPAGAAVHSTTARTPTWSSSLRWPFVRPGNFGERVFAVQYLLQNKGFGVRADGRYGPATTAAVRSFQRSRHLNPSGNVGPSTWNRLVVHLQRGDRGSAVRAVQHNLKFAYGFRFMRVTGFFNRETQRAVSAFQRGSHLAVNGMVGHRTWKTIIVFER
jgi:peptidoglycan hydrolase-like protein with peptidoglycan-binding domain